MVSSGGLAAGSEGFDAFDAAAAPNLLAAMPGGPGGEVMPLEVMERHMIIKSLDRTEGNRTQAAQLLVPLHLLYFFF